MTDIDIPYYLHQDAPYMSKPVVACDNLQWTTSPEQESYQHLLYSEFVTATSDKKRTMETCIWVTAVLDFLNGYGPGNLVTIYWFLDRIIPDSLSSEYAKRWTEWSELAKRHVDRRYSQADEETKATLRAEGRHELNITEQRHVPLLALLEALLGDDWQGKCQTAVDSASVRDFSDETAYQHTMDTCRSFLEVKY
ncbi:hypothetical protein B0I72DRAFT_13960 [Yarrowia lipolytica]|jgi:hypothetical protein|uniref:YALI0C08833p n=2 Tax=Yarrowia lipolytica TaxID=4952 RepID=Q6CCJ6_YARLI|nr:YALI0C08833p [Yarrowia lipolytica CLIB122]QNP96508.1 Hypothetical protein YALI2_C00161g [Yarrowia lipolytica]RDW25682.1 hypothetical protein B0I71DRAFT_38514 [Yarrowia lipolytica]RDW30101.1 hypothetical protein B0I72DRAFT_13960 [Yarrowia lipolytica]RDW41718.1 hypothetical protein B0I73DRAFT_46823 [Yarrowia lipolytica]RDW46206.1 hypothetical protein B0I74DRAFT_30226 [Yarrowia lipolytica]|eukprot:XP_501616.2 YALI0C08833p [Yarrowia lipolytica CLIB122]